MPLNISYYHFYYLDFEEDNYVLSFARLYFIFCKTYFFIFCIALSYLTLKLVNLVFKDAKCRDIFRFINSTIHQFFRAFSRNFGQFSGRQIFRGIVNGRLAAVATDRDEKSHGKRNKNWSRMELNKAPSTVKHVGKESS